MTLSKTSPPTYGNAPSSSKKFLETAGSRLIGLQTSDVKNPSLFAEDLSAISCNLSDGLKNPLQKRSAGNILLQHLISTQAI